VFVGASPPQTPKIQLVSHSPEQEQKFTIFPDGGKGSIL
jgi:hypothetical protein